jgi:hypothetical protein
MTFVNRLEHRVCVLVLEEIARPSDCNRGLLERYPTAGMADAFSLFGWSIRFGFSFS